MRRIGGGLLAAAAWILLRAVPLRAVEDPLIAQADLLAAKGRFAAAAALLRTAERREAVAGQARVARARILRDAGYYFFENGLFSEALRAARAALAAHEDDQEARYRAAVLLYEGGRYAEAGDLFAKLLEAQGSGAYPLAAVYRRAAAQLAKAAAGKEGQAGAEGKGGDSGAGCDLCWKPLSGEIVQLEDGRRRCASCASGAVNDERELEGIRATVASFLRDGLGLKFPKPISVHLVSKKEMGRLAGERLSSFSGVTPEDLAGLFAPYAERLTVYVLSGLPRVETVRVVAHELAHAWVAQQCPPDVPLGSNEGFSEWVAYRALLAAGHAEEASWMFLEPGPYGVHFKRFEVIGRIGGAEATLTRMQEGGL